MSLKSISQWKVIDDNQPMDDSLQLSKHIQKALHNLVKDGSQIKSYLNRDVEYNAEGLNDIDIAWRRLEQARDNQEKVLVYGDYDVDGMTSTTIMAEGLQHFGIDTSYVVPDRAIDGYGPSKRLYQKALEAEFSLIVTVDNGISGGPIIDEYSDLGLDVIVTDHHEPNGDMIPTKAIAKVHPMLSPNYPFNGLCGAGVAYKFITYKMPELTNSLETLAAMGTIADVMPLTDENRRIVSQGLELLKTTNRKALKALKEVKRIDDESINTETIGFNIAPMLNSIGRIGNPMDGVRLLMETDNSEAMELATKIDGLNEHRKQMVESLTDQALSQAYSQLKDHEVLFVGGSNKLWNQGIVGIIAAKVVEKTHKPVLAMSFKEGSDGDNIIHGSARSVGDYDIFKCMQSAQDLFDSMGGHAGAAGFGIHQHNIEALQARLDEYVRQYPLPTSEPAVTVTDVLSFDDFNVDFYNELQKLGPFGQNNPNPIWGVELKRIVKVDALGKTKQHVKILGEDEDGHQITILGFFKGSDYDILCQIRDAGSKFFAIGTLSLNIFRGNKTVQLFATDWGDEF